VTTGIGRGISVIVVLGACIAANASNTPDGAGELTDELADEVEDEEEVDAETVDSKSMVDVKWMVFQPGNNNNCVQLKCTSNAGSSSPIKLVCKAAVLASAPVRGSETACVDAGDGEVAPDKKSANRIGVGDGEAPVVLVLELVLQFGCQSQTVALESGLGMHTSTRFAHRHVMDVCVAPDVL
jgi:hypothetical protein